MNGKFSLIWSSSLVCFFWSFLLSFLLEFNLFCNSVEGYSIVRDNAMKAKEKKW